MGNGELKEDVPARVRMNIWVSKNTYDFLESVGKRDNRSMSDLVRESLRDYIVKDRQSMSDSEEIINGGN